VFRGGGCPGSVRAAKACIDFLFRLPLTRGRGGGGGANEQETEKGCWRDERGEARRFTPPGFLYELGLRSVEGRKGGPTGCAPASIRGPRKES